MALLSHSVWAVDLYPLEIISKNHTTSYQVELANNDLDRTIGLMNRTELPQNQGMLFLFDREKVVYMWMRNTLIPLDMIFIDSNNRIVSIYKNAKPNDETIISSQTPVTQVLELNAGSVVQNHIQIGDKILIK